MHHSSSINFSKESGLAGIIVNQEIKTNHNGWWHPWGKEKIYHMPEENQRENSHCWLRFKRECTCSITQVICPIFSLLPAIIEFWICGLRIKYRYTLIYVIIVFMESAMNKCVKWRYFSHRFNAENDGYISEWINFKS
jgi:hypothetical protein